MFEQFPDMERFDEIIVCPSADRNQPAVCIVQRGDDQDGCPPVGWICPQHSTQFETVGLRHHQVEDEKIGVFVVCDFNCLAAFVQGNHFIAIHQKHLFKKCCRSLIVIYHDDLCHSLFSTSNNGWLINTVQCLLRSTAVKLIAQKCIKL